MSSPSTSQWRTKVSINSGGCWPSESMNTTASPIAASRPAVSAASLPKLRLRRISSTRARPSGRAAMTPALPSPLPSST
jgi:hypothetical protein